MRPYLKTLVIEQQLAFSEAKLIDRRWKRSPGDVWATPGLEDIPHRLRRKIDARRGHLRKAIPFDEQEA